MKIIFNGLTSDIKVSIFLSRYFNSKDAEKLLSEVPDDDGFVEGEIDNQFLGEKITVILGGHCFKRQKVEFILDSELIYNTFRIEKDRNIIDYDNECKEYWSLDCMKYYSDSLESMKNKITKLIDDDLKNQFTLEVAICILLLIPLSIVYYFFGSNHIFMNVDNINSIFGRVTETLVVLFTVTFVGYVFFKNMISELVNKSTRNGLYNKIDWFYFANILIVTFVLVLTLLFNYIIVNFVEYGSYWSNLMISIGLYLSILSFLTIIYFSLEMVKSKVHLKLLMENKGVNKIGVLPLIYNTLIIAKDKYNESKR